MADISKIKLPNGSEYNLKDSLGRKEAYLEWGGKNFSASYGPIDAAMIGDLGANRFAFLKPAGIVVEYSNDGGVTWVDYGLSDVNKTAIFGNSGSAYLGKHSTNGTSSINDQLRITISTASDKAAIYSYLNKFAIYMSTNGNTVQVKIEVANESTPNDYTTLLDWTGIAGWSGWNILNTTGITTYGNVPASQKGRIRFIFRQIAISSTRGAAEILRIMAFGGVGWTTPSTMAKTGHLYSYDNAQNATFPANVTASRFIGPSDSVRDSRNGITTTLAFGKTGLSTTSWFAAWDGYEIRAISPSSTANTSLTALPDWTANPTDTTKLIRRDTGGASSFGQVTFSTVWNYIKSKIESLVLSTSTSSTSTTTAATSSAVKTAYDLANQANSTANTALSGLNGSYIYDHTFSITNGVATFTPHVYLKGAEVTSTFAASCFVWKYRLINGSEVTLATKSDRGCDVTITSMGYGGHVIGAFTPPA